MIVAGVLFFRSDDQAAVVESAIRADEVRPFRLMALRALDHRHGLELPVCRPAAARLRARGLPLRICHRLLLRMLAAASAVALEATIRAESPAIFVAEEYDRKRRVNELSHEIPQIEFVAG